MEKLSEKILTKIKTENVKPKPRWHFVLLNILLGFAIFISIVIGSIAVAIVIRHFSLTDWELAHHVAGGRLKSIAVVLPYIWLIFIALVIILADRLFVHTKKGHQIKAWIVALVTVLASIILGTTFFFIKIDRPIHDILRENIKLYEDWENKKNLIFVAADKGVLAGEIKTIEPDFEWVVLDFKGSEWLVDVKEAKFKFVMEPEIGMKVGMIGMMTDPSHFRAINIGLWEKPFPPPPIPLPLNSQFEAPLFFELKK